MPKIETHHLKVDNKTVDVDINFSTKSHKFSISKLPGEITSSLGITDLYFDTYQEVLDALKSIVEKYLPTITTREKVILITARINGKASSEFENKFVPHTIGRDFIKLSNEFTNKYGFIREYGGNMFGTKQEIIFDYELAYRIKVGDHNRYMKVNSFEDVGDGYFVDEYSFREFNYIILDYSPELEKFLKEFQEAIYRLSKKLIDFFVELKEDTTKCIEDRQKFLQLEE